MRTTIELVVETVPRISVKRPGLAPNEFWNMLVKRRKSALQGHFWIP